MSIQFPSKQKTSQKPLGLQLKTCAYHVSITDRRSRRYLKKNDYDRHNNQLLEPSRRGKEAPRRQTVETKGREAQTTFDKLSVREARQAKTHGSPASSMESQKPRRAGLRQVEEIPATGTGERQSRYDSMMYVLRHRKHNRYHQ